MQGEKYIIDCPRCGKVEGFAPAEVEQDEHGGPETIEGLIEEQEFDVAGHPIIRIRCPRCGNWLPPDRAQPED